MPRKICWLLFRPLRRGREPIRWRGKQVMERLGRMLETGHVTDATTSASQTGDIIRFPVQTTKQTIRRQLR